MRRQFSVAGDSAGTSEREDTESLWTSMRQLEDPEEEGVAEGLRTLSRGDATEACERREAIDAKALRTLRRRCKASAEVLGTLRRRREASTQAGETPRRRCVVEMSLGCNGARRWCTTPPHGTDNLLINEAWSVPDIKWWAVVGCWIRNVIRFLSPRWTLFGVFQLVSCPEFIVLLASIAWIMSMTGDIFHIDGKH